MAEVSSLFTGVWSRVSWINVWSTRPHADVRKKKVIMQKLLLYLRSPYIYKINSLWQSCIYLSQQAIRYLDPCETFKPNTCFFFMITSKVNVLKNVHIIPSTLLQMQSDMLRIFFLRFLDLTEIKNKVLTFLTSRLWVEEIKPRWRVTLLRTFLSHIQHI